MRTLTIALVVGLGLTGLGGLANADHAEPGMSSKWDETKKHLTEVDAYIQDALNNAKVLYSMSQIPMGKMDQTIQRENINNLEKAISSALIHVGHFKSSADPKMVEMDKVDDLHRFLTDSRNVLPQLRSAMKSSDRQQLGSVTSQLFAKLKEADERYGNIAEKQNVARLDKISVPEKQPVRGTEELKPKQMQPEQHPQPNHNY